MSFLLLLLYVSAIYIRPQEWILAIYAWPLIYVLAILTAISVFMETSMRQNIRYKGSPNILMLAFFGTILLSHMSHTYLAGTINAFWGFLPNLIMFFLFVNVLISEQKIKITIWLIVVLTFILALQGIHQWNTGIGWAGQEILGGIKRGEGVIRRITWIGIFNDPNDLALALVVGGGFLVAFIFGKTNFFIKLISMAALPVLMRALYYTNSRGGYLAMAATVGFYFLLRVKNKILALGVGGILGFAVIIVGPARMAQVTVAEASALGRIDAWFHGFQMLKSAPIFGVGYGMWGDFLALTAHNSYILVAAELGLIGLFVWVSLLFMCAKGMWIIAENNISMRPYALGTISSLGGFLAASYFLSRSYISILYILLSISAGSMYTFLDKKDYIFDRKNQKIAAGLTVLILLAVWLSMRVALRLVR